MRWWMRFSTLLLSQNLVVMAVLIKECLLMISEAGAHTFLILNAFRERAHMPKNLWERVKLPRNYKKALETIDKHLLCRPELLQHKIKQRLTKMTQVCIRMRNLLLRQGWEKITTTPRRDIKRESRREEKAVKAAVLDTTDHVTSGLSDESKMQRH
ncbi:hypothetical protein Bca52824_033434 [Brassica carinata]|uniref:Ribosomal eL28/Mak16 domain-containing protein n=1 Tax=Brassica carinata TaxID=52824 RepID=A0A8X7SEH1_BRACI|nr:hypothetical protein Bca52824_033434 [Brassica carinata]